MNRNQHPRTHILYFESADSSHKSFRWRHPVTPCKKSFGEQGVQGSSPFETYPRDWRVADEARAMESPIRRRPATIRRSADGAAAAVPLIIHHKGLEISMIPRPVYFLRMHTQYFITSKIPVLCQIKRGCRI